MALVGNGSHHGNSDPGFSPCCFCRRSATTLSWSVLQRRIGLRQQVFLQQSTRSAWHVRRGPVSENGLVIGEGAGLLVKSCPFAPG